MSGTFTNILLHIVFSTKNREPMIPSGLEAELFAYIGGIFRGERGTLLCAGGASDHVHLLGAFPAAVSVSDMMRKIKANSTNWINEQRRIPGYFSWQDGYGAFSVSESAKDDVMAYIQGQKEHHRKVSFQDEFLAFLQKHQIPYDERYIWR